MQRPDQAVKQHVYGFLGWGSRVRYRRSLQKGFQYSFGAREWKGAFFEGFKVSVVLRLLHSLAGREEFPEPKALNSKPRLAGGEANPGAAYHLPDLRFSADTMAYNPGALGQVDLELSTHRDLGLYPNRRTS